MLLLHNNINFSTVQTNRSASKQFKPVFTSMGRVFDAVNNFLQTSIVNTSKIKIELRSVVLKRLKDLRQ